MKPGPITQANFQSIPLGSNWKSGIGTDADNPFSFQDFTVPHQMPHQEVAPPPYLWDKIASVLDEQNKVRAQARASFFHAKKKFTKSQIYILVATITVAFAVIILTLV